MGPTTVWSRIHLFINYKVCKCSAGGRAEKLGVQVTNTRLSNFQYGKETIYLLHSYSSVLPKFSMARIDFIKLTHLISSLTTNSKLCTVYLFTFRLHTNSLYAVYNRSVIWRPCATLGNCLYQHLLGLSFIYRISSYSFHSWIVSSVKIQFIR